MRIEGESEGRPMDVPAVGTGKNHNRLCWGGKGGLVLAYMYSTVCRRGKESAKGADGKRKLPSL